MKGEPMKLKTIQPSNYEEINQLLKISFTATEHGYEKEAELVQKIRLEKTYNQQLEIIAEKNTIIVGHGLLSEVQIIGKAQQLTGLVLAPLAVLPAYQQTGIGTAILKELEKRAKKSGYPFISILGHPSYYHRFAYTAASHFNVVPPYPLPDEAFMIKELVQGSLADNSGRLFYSSAFD